MCIVEVKVVFFAYVVLTVQIMYGHIYLNRIAKVLLATYYLELTVKLLLLGIV